MVALNPKGPERTDERPDTTNMCMYVAVIPWSFDGYLPNGVPMLVHRLGDKADGKHFHFSAVRLRLRHCKSDLGGICPATPHGCLGDSPLVFGDNVAETSLPSGGGKESFNRQF